jgi:hydrogenase expression/formation protein HypC
MVASRSVSLPWQPQKAEDPETPYFVILLKILHMCLSIPARIESIEGDTAVCSVGGATYQASLQLLESETLVPGDYVLIHTGFAIQKISEEEAAETLRIFDDFDELNRQLDDEERQTGQRIV